MAIIWLRGICRLVCFLLHVTERQIQNDFNNREMYYLPSLDHLTIIKWLPTATEVICFLIHSVEEEEKEKEEEIPSSFLL